LYKLFNFKENLIPYLLFVPSSFTQKGKAGVLKVFFGWLALN